MNYKNVNLKLLQRYRNKIRTELNDLYCKSYGEYFGGTKFTRKDQSRYELLQNKLRKIGSFYL